MRDLKRNKQKIFYSTLVVGEATDEWGNPCKEYSEPTELYISLSADKGEAQAQGFGVDLQYDRTMATADTNCPINEYSRLWLDGATTEQPHNYEVSAVSKSLNSIKYAIKRVDVS